MRSEQLVPFGVGVALFAKGLMAAGSGAIGLTGLLMGQRLSLHAALVTGASGMAGFTPSGTVTHARIMVHSLRRPGRRTAVTGIAVHRRAVEQLRFRNVIGHLGHSATVIALRSVGTAMTRLASGSTDNGVIHGHGRIEADLRFVT